MGNGYFVKRFLETIVAKDDQVTTKHKTEVLAFGNSPPAE